MAEAFVYDAVRTPRGRGKKDGSLHEVPAVRLGAKVLEALRDRNGLDTSTVDDIIFGCVDPVGEAGSVIPRAAAFEAGYDTKAPGMQISRFCASGLDAINFGAAKIAQGSRRDRDRRRRGIDESRRHGHVGRGLVHGPVGRPAGLVRAAGHLRRFDRHEVRLFARRRRRLCGGKPEARRQGLGRRPVQELGHPDQGPERPHRSSTATSTCGRRPTCRRWPPSTRPSSCRARWAASTPWPCRSIPRSRRSTTSTMPAIRPASSTARPACCSARRRPARRWA